MLPNLQNSLLYTLPSLSRSVRATGDRQRQPSSSLASVADKGQLSWEHLCGASLSVAEPEQHSQTGEAAEAPALTARPSSWDASRSHDWIVLCPQKEGDGTSLASWPQWPPGPQSLGLS